MESGLRHRQRDRLMRRIDEVAQRLFEGSGFEATTVAAVAEAAETSPRAVFRYFGSKEGLVFWTSDRLLAQLRGFLAERPKDEPAYDALKHAMRSYTDLMSPQRPDAIRRLRLISESAGLLKRQAEIREEWIDALSRDVAARAGTPDVGLEHRTVVLGAFGALSAAYDVWCREDGATYSELLDRALRHLEDNVRGSSTA
jgi:TetR/AcrR family transcriptional regulator, regulator of mycofactocin system